MTRFAWTSVLVVAGCVPLSGETSDGGMEGAAPFHRRDGGTMDAHPPVCGDATCAEPTSPGPLGNVACCLPTGECGLEPTALGTDCSPRGALGGVDLACPARSLPGWGTVQGCCRTSGRCGLLDPSGELGCVDYGADSATCSFHGTNDCSSIVELPCDGPEDCPTGRVCCGRAQRDHYDAFGCFTSCDGLFDDQSGVWLEICHPGSACLNSRYTCEPSTLTPTFLARCRDPGPPMSIRSDGSADAAALDASLDGDRKSDASLVMDASDGAESSAGEPPGIACGPNTCAEGEKCCLRTRGGTTGEIDPYCAKMSAVCGCSVTGDP